MVPQRSSLPTTPIRLTWTLLIVWWLGPGLGNALVPAQPMTFETAKPGGFANLETGVGVWTTVSGNASIQEGFGKDRSGCLHLSGDETVVELDYVDSPTGEQELSFLSERWTSQQPFRFRVEQLVGEQWKAIYNGDSLTRVGRTLLSSVRLKLLKSDQNRLRFLVTSPPAKGVLIDEVNVSPVRPQIVTGAEVVPVILPALIGAKSSALLKLNIKTTGSLTPISLAQISGSLTPETNLDALSSIQLHATVGETEFHAAGMLGDPIDPAKAFSITANQPLSEGDNFFWIACTLNDRADLDRTIGAVCESLSFSDGSEIRVDSAASRQRLGVSLRAGGDQGVHTYRIPGLATTKRGTLIAVYDVRYRGGGDLPGDIDVGMSRSTDGGRSWQPMQIIMDLGDDPAMRYDGVGDPSILVDSVTGTIWCSGLWSHGNRGWHGSGPGITPAETGQFMLVRSDDDGVTWSDPINITEQIKRPEWCLLLQGPGKGITMHDGTLVFPAQYQDSLNADNRTANRLPRSSIVFSRDSGKTWSSGGGAYDDTTEAQVIELADGQLMLNCRYNRESKRVVMMTNDLGKTWTQHASHRSALIEPGACMASLINVARELETMDSETVDSESVENPNLLLFSNPNSTSGRNRMTIKASRDGGLTWPEEHRLLVDEQPSAGYSCLSMIDDETVGILYEGSQADMTFQRIKLSDILDTRR